MTTIVSFLSFPSISWWQQAIAASELVLDGCEHYEKMTMRNRYRIAGSNNPILLSVPLTSGRNQRTAMRDVEIYNRDRWQVQHWRTLVSVYRRTPFFEHYEPSLQSLFEKEYARLTDFNRDSMLWVMKQLRLNIPVAEANAYIADYGSTCTDLRQWQPGPQWQAKRYYQVFEDRIGFQPDMSILDLLFSEGPATLNFLR